MLIVNICVNYNNTPRVNRFIHDHMVRDEYFDHLYVVDNSNNFVLDEGLNFLRGKKLTILIPGDNLGYMGACRHAYESCLVKIKKKHVVILSNVDLNILTSSKNFKKNILEKVGVDIGVISPLVLHQGSEIYYPAEQLTRTPVFKYMIKKVVFNFYPALLFYDTYTFVRHFIHRWFAIKKSSHKKIVSKKVYAPCGSFMIFTPEYRASGLNFNYPVFLFGEEVFVAESCLENSLSVFFDTSIVIAHEGYDTTNIFSNKAMLKYKREAINFQGREYFK